MPFLDCLSDLRDPEGLMRALEGLTERYASGVWFSWSGEETELLREFLPEAIAIKVFDLAVNLGSRTAVKCLQRALQACGLRVVIDGILGTETCGAARQADRKALIAALRSEAAGEYRLLVARHSDQIVFQGGWLNRAYA